MKGEELKQKLQERGLEMKWLAAKLGMSPQNLNSIFRGDDVKSGVLEKVSIVTGLPLSFFYEGRGMKVHSDQWQLVREVNDKLDLILHSLSKSID